MTKTISLETSKKLAPHLEGIETEYFWVKEVNEDKWIIVYWDSEEPITEEEIKTLTLEEAIEILPKSFGKEFQYWNLEIKFNNWNSILRYTSYEKSFDITVYEVTWKTLLEAIEKMLEYLFDKNLLWQSISN